MIQLSIVSTLYRSAPHLNDFYKRMVAAAEQLGLSFELILVNDGSPDESQTIAESLCDSDPRVVLLELSRNYGHHKAILTGLRASKGDLVFLLDSDLEEPPELLTQFHQEMERTGADVIYGVQRDRKGGHFERWSGRAFYSLFNVLSVHPIPPNHSTARLMSRQYVESLVQHRDQEVFLAGLFSMTGFRQRALPIDKGFKGTTSYSVAKRLMLLVNAVTSFSSKPLTMIFFVGGFISLVSGAAGVYLIVKRTFGELLAGWASIMVSIWFLGGLIMLSLGIIGIYLSKIFTETKQRPLTLVRSTRGNRAHGALQPQWHHEALYNSNNINSPVVGPLSSSPAVVSTSSNGAE